MNGNATEPGLMELCELTLKRAHDLRDRTTSIGNALMGESPEVTHGTRAEPMPLSGYGGVAGMVAQLHGVLGFATDSINRIERVLGPAKR